MKNIIFLLLMSFLWSCHVQKQIDKSEASTEKRENLDSTGVRREQSTRLESKQMDSSSIGLKTETNKTTETKTDNTVTTIKEHITNLFAKQQPGDSTKTPALISQTIDREITERKAVNEQKETDRSKRDSTASKKASSEEKVAITVKSDSSTLNKQLDEKGKVKTVKKVVEKRSFSLPWWAWMIVVALILLFVKKLKLLHKLINFIKIT